MALLLGSLLIPAQAWVIRADDSTPPHLGYGIHIAPNTNVNPSLVDQLGMDWVKIYEPGQVGAFPGKRILYRMDLRWPGDWNQFKGDVANRARALAGLKIAAVEIGNEPNLINERLSKVAAVTKEDVQRVAKQYLVDTNRTVVITMPKAKARPATGSSGQ